MRRKFHNLVLDVGNSLQYARLLPGEEYSLSGTIRPLRDLEREAILYALTALQGNTEAAAKALKIGRSTLYSKLKQYGVRAESLAVKEDANVR